MKHRIICICIMAAMIISAFFACSPADKKTGGDGASAPAQISTPEPEEGVTASNNAQYFETARAVLSGRGGARFVFSPENTLLFFGFDGDSFCAYEGYLNEYSDRSDGQGYRSGREPAAEFPRSLGEAAQKAIARDRIEYSDVGSELDPEFMPWMEGFVCGDCVVVTNCDDLWHDEAVTCLFMRDADGSWREIGNNNASFPRKLSGACMVSENELYLCFYDRYLGPEGGSGRKLCVFRTADGGAEWKNIGLELPEEYGEPYTLIPGSPVFEGKHGVILITAYYTGRDKLEGWFETTDGGESWTFVDPAK